MEQKIDDNKLNIGDQIPEFNLPGIDGKDYGSDSFDKDVIVVIFTCNHCPYAKAYHDRTVQLQEDFDVQFIGINSNDGVGYPEDSLEKMKERDDFNYPYLRDEDQSVAKAFGAQLTPEAYVFKDKKLVYHGRIDDNWKNPDEATSHDLKVAIRSATEGMGVGTPETAAIGCSIKWLG